MCLSGGETYVCSLECVHKTHPFSAEPVPTPAGGLSIRAEWRGLGGGAAAPQPELVEKREGHKDL